MDQVASRLWQMYQDQLLMMIFLIVLTYTTVETINFLIRSIPDVVEKWGKKHSLLPKDFDWFTAGFGSTAKRVVAALSALAICWIFKFAVVADMFTAYHGSRKVNIQATVSYLLTAGFLLIFSKIFYKFIDSKLKKWKSQESTK